MSYRAFQVGDRVVTDAGYPGFVHSVYADWNSDRQWLWVRFLRGGLETVESSHCKLAPKPVVHEVRGSECVAGSPFSFRTTLTRAVEITPEVEACLRKEGLL